MGYLDLFTSITAAFGGFQMGFEEAEFVIVGAPFDATSTYRSGSRFAPLAIREASLNIEAYSFRAGISLGELKIHDMGDLHVTGDMNETLRRLELVTGEVLSKGKILTIIGGEHTVTLGAVKGIRGDFALLSFDAHLDLRNEYMDQKVCHTTFMRRINENVKPSRIVEVGTRAVCKEEIDYAESSGVIYITSHRIADDGVMKIAREINNLLADYERIYLTVDMDVLDPAFAPAVQNPEPDGLSTHMLLDLLSKICNRRVIALDVVEVAPHYDMGITAIQAARAIFEALCCIHKGREEKIC